MILARRSVLPILAACFVWSAAAASARAGGGPENVAIVVNADSWASLAVANEFIHLRKVPARNVIYLRGVQEFERTNIDDFRKTILQPVLDAVEKRGLTGQIDYVVYSSDLPTEIDFASEAPQAAVDKLGPVSRSVTKAGSINGLTFLHSLVLAKDIHYVELNANHYFRPIERREGKVGTRREIGFRSSFAWGADGNIVPPEQGTRYLLSTVLGVTSGRGNSVREAIQCLQRAASADGNRPKGTVYFCRNGDIRSKTREPFFAPAAETLAALDVPAEVLDGVLPKDKKDVAGLMIGTADFNWKSCGSEILPGAICEHFTSWGGILREGASQTPLTEFLRYGAAAASGTVTEPYAIAQKFPTAFVQVHYARGCSVAEAFYQSVSGPYQLLIVGDPLCQPWAKFPQVTADVMMDGGGAKLGTAVKPGATVSGKLTIRPGVAQKDMEIGRYELFVDGLRKAGGPPGEALELDTGALDQGWHELRVVAVAKEPPQTQGRLILPVTVSRGGAKLTVTPPKEAGVIWDSPLAIHASLPGAKRIAFLHNDREVGAIQGADGAAKLDLRAIGQGRALVQPVGVIAGKDGNESRILGEPLALEVRPPMPIVPPAGPAESTLAKGVLVLLPGGGKVAADKFVGDWLNKCGVKAGQDFEVQAVFAVPDDDTYQFQLRTNVNPAMELDGRKLELPPDTEWRFIPLSLAKGTHRFVVKGKGAPGVSQLELRFGGPGARSIVNIFQHVRAVGETGPAKP